MGFDVGQTSRELNEIHVSFKFISIYHTVQWTRVHVHTCKCRHP